MEKVSQSEMILQHLIKQGSITPLEALKNYGCFRLGARIYDLKNQGYKINSKVICRDDKHFAEYSMV